MFIRVNKTPNSPRCSVQIVESIRTGDKIRTKIVRHVGIARDEEEVQKLKDYGKELVAKIISVKRKCVCAAVATSTGITGRNFGACREDPW